MCWNSLCGTIKACSTPQVSTRTPALVEDNGSDYGGAVLVSKHGGGGLLYEEGSQGHSVKHAGEKPDREVLTIFVRWILGCERVCSAAGKTAAED